MSLDNFEIKLDNSWNTYYAGQTVEGKVILKFDTLKTIRGVKICFLGEAKTKWKKRTRDGTKTYKGHEEYFKIKYYLMGSNDSKIQLPSSTHTYPFTFDLPPNLPSSFECKYGHIRFTIKATLDLPWEFDDNVKMAFTVIAPVDLNVDPRIKEPFKLELEKTFCCFCCNTGVLSVVTSVPVTGYVSGQVIPIVCECDNASGIKILTVKFILQKLLTLRTTTPSDATKIFTNTITESETGPVAGVVSRVFNQQLEIPTLPPTILHNCTVISLHYNLLIVCEVDGFHIGLSGNIPITLGTIPLVIDDPFLAPTETDTPNNDAQLYPNTPPQQFKETRYSKTDSIFDSDDEENTNVKGDKNFSPRYPTVRFDVDDTEHR